MNEPRLLGESPLGSLGVSACAQRAEDRQGIVQVFHSPDKAGRTAVNFIVDDLDKYLAGLDSRGITATEPQAVSQGRQSRADVQLDNLYHCS